MTTPAEPDSSLTAMISTLAQVNAAQQNGQSWNDIAEAFGYPSGRQAKKIIHELRDQVKRELTGMLARQDAKVTS